MRKILLFLFVLVSASLVAQDTKSIDTTSNVRVVIKLKDNNALVARMISDTGKTITVETAAGILSIQKQNVISIERTFNKYYKVTLTDGSILTGGVVKETPQGIELYVESVGTVNLSTGKILKKEVIGDRTSTGSSFPNPHSTRYLFAPSAIPIEKGEGYYQNIYILYNSVNYGVSEHVSVGGGIVFPIAAFITPKISYEVAKNVHLGAGVLAGATVIGMTPFGVAYGLGTIGSREHNFTIGGGYAYFGDDWTESPIITISGMTRLGKNIGIVSENWILPADDLDEPGVFSLSLRIMGRNHSADIGLVAYYSFGGYNSETFAIPFLGYVYKFGSRDALKKNL